ncbi:hypothetical protein GWI33_005550 [Rhynchophorus ferrugineus]|uniref:Uncharacterized protein n=1 Tax=Rhynchophorus ferrugineus TaxID=354439 RepID=A0A834MEB8_RHYFE|nr:hypothetical protein GWI33_005550 [Rhynchophorus ferrugineus]
MCSADAHAPKRSYRRRRLSRGVTSLMYAAQQGDVASVRTLVATQYGFLLDQDRTGKTALHYCCTSDSICAAQAADVLTMAAPDLVESRDEDGFTPLHLAVIAGNTQLVTFLLANGADVNAVDNEKHTVVHWATVCGETTALRAVLAAGAPVSTPDVHGGYPLHYAAQMCGGDKDSSLGLQVLHALLGHKDINVSVEDGDRRQPLLWAASAGSVKALLALVRAGAPVEASDRDGLTALHCAASRGHTDCIDTLLTLCGATPDVIDSNGCTALHYAVTLGHADATALLLAHGADPNRQDRKGRSPPHCGCAKGQFETVKLIGARGANLWLRNARGDMPLHEAAASGRRELVTWLLGMRPSQVNARNNDGRTPLHMAALNDNVDMCKILLDSGAQVNPILRTSKNVFMTPLDCALQRGFRSTAKFLQLHGGVPACRAGTQTIESQVTSSVNLQIRDDVTFWGDSSSNSEDEKGVERKGSKKMHKKRATHKSRKKKDPVSDSDSDLPKRKMEKSDSFKSGGFKRTIKVNAGTNTSANGFKTESPQKSASSRIDYSNEIIINGKTEINIHHTKEFTVDTDGERISPRKVEIDTNEKIKVPSSDAPSEKVKRPKSAKSGKGVREAATVSDLKDQKPESPELSKSASVLGHSTGTSDDTMDTVIDTYKLKAEVLEVSREPVLELPEISNTSEEIDEPQHFVVEASVHPEPKYVTDEEEKHDSVSEKIENNEHPDVPTETAENKEPFIVNEPVKSNEEIFDEKIIEATTEIPEQAQDIKNVEVSEGSPVTAPPEQSVSGDKEDENANIETVNVAADPTKTDVVEPINDKPETVQSRINDDVECKRVSGTKEDIADSREATESGATVEGDDQPSSLKGASEDNLTVTVNGSTTEVVTNGQTQEDVISTEDKHEILEASVVKQDVAADLIIGGLEDGNEAKIEIVQSVDKPAENGEEIEDKKIGKNEESGDDETAAKYKSSKAPVSKVVRKPREKKKDTVDSSRRLTPKEEESKRKKTTATRHTPTGEKPSDPGKKSEKINEESYSSSSEALSDSLEQGAKTHKSFKILSEKEARELQKQMPKGKSKQKKEGDAQKPRSKSEESKSKKAVKEEKRMKMSKIPTPIFQTPRSKSERYLDRLGDESRRLQNGIDARVPSLPNINASSRERFVRDPVRPDSNLSAPIVPAYSDHDRDSMTDIEDDAHLSPAKRKKVKKKAKTKRRESKSAGSDYESSNLIDSGFEPSPRSSRIPKWRNMSDRSVNMNSVTRSIQTNIRRYHLERKIFQHLLELKRSQIRAGQHNEAMLVKRAIDQYNQSCSSTVGAGRYVPEDFTFKSFEKFLYESLRRLQKIDVEYLKALPATSEHVNPLLCTQSTHRCMHATHAYTGIPCAAYLPKMDHHSIPKIGYGNTTNCKPGMSGFLPNIVPKKSVTLELSHGADKQIISLPTDRLDHNKRYYVTFTVKGQEKGSSDDNGNGNGHIHAKSD